MLLTEKQNTFSFCSHYRWNIADLDTKADLDEWKLFTTLCCSHIALLLVLCFLEMKQMTLGITQEKPTSWMLTEKGNAYGWQQWQVLSGEVGTRGSAEFFWKSTNIRNCRDLLSLYFCWGAYNSWLSEFFQLFLCILQEQFHSYLYKLNLVFHTSCLYPKALQIFLENLHKVRQSYSLNHKIIWIWKTLKIIKP